MPAKSKAQPAQKVYDNTNRGALWANRNKLSDKHPNYTGLLDVDGKQFRVAVWDQESSNDKAPIMSIQITPKEK